MGVGTPVIVLHILLLGTILVLLPTLACIQAVVMGRVDPEARMVEDHRWALYRDTVVVLLLLGVASAVLGVQRHGWVGMGLNLPPGGWTALTGWSFVAVAGGLAVTALAHLVGLAARIPERPLVAALLPRTPRERLAFSGVSAAAGVGEEAAFRGYALAGLTALAGVPAAVLLSSLSFGLSHAYQGPLGVARTATVGLVLAWITLAAGSLWPAVVGHMLLNIIMGFVGGERLLRRSPSTSNGT
jgi:uncharacterized protein